MLRVLRRTATRTNVTAAVAATQQLVKAEQSDAWVCQTQTFENMHAIWCEK
jgi:hypothetical protein